MQRRFLPALLSLPWLLAACHAVTPTDPPALTHLEGRVSPDEPFAEVVGFDADTPSDARALVDAHGRFTLPLPSGVATQPPEWLVDDPSCAGDVNVSNPHVRHAELLSLRAWRSGVPSTMSTRRVTSGVYEEFVYVFATAASTVRGSRTCEDGTHAEYALTLRAGWNLKRVTYRLVGPDFFERQESVSPTRLTWSAR